MKIGVCTLTIGDVYKNVTKYGRLSKVKYCEKNGYDFIEDESVYDTNRPIPWSKVLLLEKYLPEYDYLVWLDGDTIIMNDEIRLEHFINMMGDKEFMATIDVGHFINTGVWFIKNTPYVQEILRKMYEIDESLFDARYWEQSAFGYLYKTNYKDLQNHNHIVPIYQNYLFNGTIYTFIKGDFLIHCLGIRNMKDLTKVMLDHYPFKRDDENDDMYKWRMEWFDRMYKDRKVKFRNC